MNKLNINLTKDLYDYVVYDQYTFNNLFTQVSLGVYKFKDNLKIIYIKTNSYSYQLMLDSFSDVSTTITINQNNLIQWAKELNVVFDETGLIVSFPEIFNLYYEDSGSSNGIEYEYTEEIIVNDNIYELTIDTIGLKEVTITNLFPENFINGTWSTVSGGNLTAAKGYMGSAGTQNSALCFGGNTGSVTTVTEKFNGSTWTTNSSWNFVSNVAKHGLGGCGTQNSALAFGGWNGSVVIAVTEKFNGFVWSTSGNLTAIKAHSGSAGTQNSALCFGGFTGTVYLIATEKFNGSTWSTNSSWNLTAIKGYMGSAGTQNSALCFGGTIAASTYTTATEKFNGSIWSNASGGNLSVAKGEVNGCGTQNSALCFGGTTGSPTAVTEKFNGSIWSLSGNLSQAKYAMGSAGR